MWTSAIVLPIVGCAPAVKRDLSTMPVGQVGFDDLCGLQTYFDILSPKTIAKPRVVSSAEIEGGKKHGGRTRFAFETDFQLLTLRRVLNENWKRLPDSTASALRIDLEVQWSDRSGLRRVVTNVDAELTIGAEATPLPYHVCLSELLFGEPIYRQRREVLGLGPLPQEKTSAATTGTDAGAVTDATSDGGVAH